MPVGAESSAIVDGPAPSTGEEWYMRKLMMVMALVVVMVPVLGAAALAADQLIQCKSIPCYGSGNDDQILERIGNRKTDKIIARGGHDLIRANKYHNDTDIVRAGRGLDKINVRDGDPFDRIHAGKGAHDWCIVDANSELAGGCERIN
jgi:hypothetical protein